eukprot:scaffold66098_cov81-Cyclotella_meneghiniana.AAC.1
MNNKDKMLSTSARDYISFIQGEIFVLGSWAALIRRQSQSFATSQNSARTMLPPFTVMNPPDIDRGIFFLERSTCERYVPTMIALGDVYVMHKLDPKKAEEWYTKALGQGKQLSPIAFTLFGLFLQSCSGRATEAIFQLIPSPLINVTYLTTPRSTY